MAIAGSCRSGGGASRARSARIHCDRRCVRARVSVQECSSGSEVSPSLHTCKHQTASSVSKSTAAAAAGSDEPIAACSAVPTPFVTHQLWQSPARRICAWHSACPVGCQLVDDHDRVSLESASHRPPRAVTERSSLLSSFVPLCLSFGQRAVALVCRPECRTDHGCSTAAVREGGGSGKEQRRGVWRWMGGKGQASQTNENGTTTQWQAEAGGGRQRGRQTASRRCSDLIHSHHVYRTLLS